MGLTHVILKSAVNNKCAKILMLFGQLNMDITLFIVMSTGLSPK